MVDTIIGLILGLIVNLIIGGFCYLFYIDLKNNL